MPRSLVEINEIDISELINGHYMTNPTIKHLRNMFIENYKNASSLSDGLLSLSLGSARSSFPFLSAFGPAWLFPGQLLAATSPAPLLLLCLGRARSARPGVLGPRAGRQPSIS